MTDMQFHRIASQFFNRPLLLSEASAKTISNFLLSRIGAGGGIGDGENDAGESRQIFRPEQRADGSLEVHSPRASRFYGEYPIDDEGGRGRPAPYRRTPEGVAIITSVGELVNRGAWVGASSGLISYEGLKYQVQKAGSDAKTKVILLDWESPGGEAVGAFEAADIVRQVAAVKPVISVVNGMAASAAYAIAAASTEIVTLPTGISGSIGVVLMHADYSRYLENEGIKPTLIHAGAHKVDGNPFEPLPATVRDELQAEVMSFYDLFVAAVAKGRKGRMTEKTIRGTEARTYMGQEAVDIGLADRVGTFESVLADLSRSSSGGGSNTQKRSVSMSDEDKKFTQADLDRARAESHAKGKAEGVAEGEATAKASTDRISAILASEKVKGRERVALDLALKSPSMSAEDVIGFVAENVKTGSSLAARASEGPSLGADTQSGPGKASASGWDKAAERFNARFGK